MSLVTEERVDKALAYLAQTDHECASWKSQVLRTEHVAKVAEALAYAALRAEGKLAAEDCKQGARTDEGVRAKWEEYFQAVKQHEVIRAQREREALIVDLYRTESANRRNGNV